MGTKNEPGDFDCYSKAENDEPIFVLLARDRLAPNVVRKWATQYEMSKGGVLTSEQVVKLNEALDCANAMDEWYRQNRPIPPDKIEFRGIDALTKKEATETLKFLDGLVKNWPLDSVVTPEADAVRRFINRLQNAIERNES